jgi:hypothetical protein
MRDLRPRVYAETLWWLLWTERKALGTIPRRSSTSSPGRWCGKGGALNGGFGDDEGQDLWHGRLRLSGNMGADTLGHCAWGKTSADVRKAYKEVTTNRDSGSSCSTAMSVRVYFGSHKLLLMRLVNLKSTCNRMSWSKILSCNHGAPASAPATVSGSAPFTSLSLARNISGARKKLRI